MLRLGYWTLVAVALPGYIILRIGAEWLYSKEGWDDLPEGVDEPAWLGIGYIIADLAALLLLVSLIVGGIGVYRMRDGKGTRAADDDARSLHRDVGGQPCRRMGDGRQAELAAHQPGYGSIRPGA